MYIYIAIFSQVKGLSHLGNNLALSIGEMMSRLDPYSTSDNNLALSLAAIMSHNLVAR